jgi:putative CRISPR-associated protein (TIGR02619 family)
MSSKLIICTTGTSIARGVQRLDEIGVKKYCQLIKNRIESVQKQSKNTNDFLRIISAEMNSLSLSGLDKSDKVVLLHTETEDGLICAENVSELIKKHFNLSSTLVKVTGLQVKDALKFRKIGIQNLFKELDHLVYGYAPENVILNGTGGFKGVVPYLTLYGLLNRISTLYLFEFSNELIKLPPVPVSYDYDRPNKAYKALEKIDSESSISIDCFFKLIPDLKYEDRPWYESLIEKIGKGEVTMSPFALIMWETMKKSEGQVYIAKQAVKSYSNSSGQVREQYNFMLSRITNPLWRNAKIHPCTGSDLEFYKPGNTSERLAGITKGNDIYVCELMQHDEYEKKIQLCQKKNYNTKEFGTN